MQQVQANHSRKGNPKPSPGRIYLYRGTVKPWNKAKKSIQWTLYGSLLTMLLLAIGQLSRTPIKRSLLLYKSRSRATLLEGSISVVIGKIKKGFHFWLIKSYSIFRVLLTTQVRHLLLGFRSFQLVFLFLVLRPHQ